MHYKVMNILCLSSITHVSFSINASHRAYVYGCYVSCFAPFAMPVYCKIIFLVVERGLDSVSASSRRVRLTPSHANQLVYHKNKLLSSSFLE